MLGGPVDGHVPEADIDYTSRKFVEKAYQIRGKELSRQSDELTVFLDQIEADQKPQYLVIGVRPNAFNDFESVRSKAEARRLLIGFEPLEQGLKVIVPDNGNMIQTGQGKSG